MCAELPNGLQPLLLESCLATLTKIHFTEVGVSLGRTLMKATFLSTRVPERSQPNAVFQVWFGKSAKQPVNFEEWEPSVSGAS